MIPDTWWERVQAFLYDHKWIRWAAIMILMGTLGTLVYAIGGFYLWLVVGVPACGVAGYWLEWRYGR